MVPEAVREDGIMQGYRKGDKKDKDRSLGDLKYLRDK